MSNRSRGLKNVLAGVLNQLITIAFGIIIPRLVLVNLGSETNGLLNTINQILVYMSLLEAGVGAASLQALYKPMAQNDHDEVNQILSATNYFYKRTGAVYFVVVLFLTFIFPFTVKTEMSKISLMLIMLFSGVPGVLNYYFQAKYKILLEAEGKKYITTNLGIVVHIGTSFGKLILLLLGFDAVALQLMYILTSVAQMAYYGIYIKKKYKWINVNTKPNFNAISQSKNALVHQVSTLIFRNTDVLILTFFCDLKVVSVYSIYTTLFSMIGTAVDHFSGFNFILGQKYNTDRQTFLKYHDVYEIVNMCITFSLYCIAGLFILPFLTLYTSGVNDINYIDKYLPYLFISTYLLSNGRSSSNQVINYAQHFKQTQWRSIAESCINIVVSLICVRLFGIYGVLFGTIIALVYRANDMIIYANVKLLKRNPLITYRRWGVNFVLFVLFTYFGKAALAFVALDNYFTIIICAVVACIIVVPSFFLVCFLLERKTAKIMIDLVKKVLH